MTPAPNAAPDSLLLLIAAMSAVTMGSRLLGFVAVRRQPAGRAKQALHYLPFGLFAAIVVAGLPPADGGGGLSFGAGALLTAWSARRGHPLVLSLLLGAGGAGAVSYLSAIIARG